MPLKIITGGGGSVILDANNTASNYTMYIPAENGALLTSGSAVNASIINSGTLSSDRLPTIPKAKLPTGTVLQVQRTESTAVFASSVNGSWTGTGISVSITPTSSTSKILVTIQLSTGQSASGWATLWGVQRNGTNIGGGTSVYGAVSGVWIATDSYQSDNQLYGLSQSHLDSPATTSSLTYQIMYYGEGNTGYLNRAGPTGSATNYATGISTITAMEIAQ